MPVRGSALARPAFPLAGTETLLGVQPGQGTAQFPLSGIRRPGCLNTEASYLPKWRRAMGRVRAGTGHARIACVGDSTHYGQGANTGANGLTACQTKNAPTQLARILSGAGLPAATNSFFGDGNNGNSASLAGLTNCDPRVTAGTGWQSAAGSVRSMGGWALYNGPGSSGGATTNPQSFGPIAGVDTFDVWYIASTGNATFTLDIDGGTPVTVNSNTATGSVQKATVTAGSVGSHTLNVKRTGVGGGCYILGADAYVVGAPSVHVLNMGWCGSKASDWGGAAYAYSPLNAFPVVGADLTLVNLGINDWLNATSPAAYLASMQAIVNAALTTGDVLLYGPLPTSTVYTPMATQQAITAQVYAIAQAQSLPLIDMTARFGGYAAANTLGLEYDTVHPQRPRLRRRRPGGGGGAAGGVSGAPISSIPWMGEYPRSGGGGRAEGGRNA